MPFAWDPDMLAALEQLGVRPVSRTPPTLVKDYVSQLYRYELRRLRHRLVCGEIAQADYKGLIIGLRPRYWMLPIPAARWADSIQGTPISSSGEP
jgi:hypothetical protein